MSNKDHFGALAERMMEACDKMADKQYTLEEREEYHMKFKKASKHYLDALRKSKQTAR